MDAREKLNVKLTEWAETGRAPFKGLTVADYNAAWDMLCDLRKTRTATTISAAAMKLMENCGFLVEPEEIGWRIRVETPLPHPECAACMDHLCPYITGIYYNAYGEGVPIPENCLNRCPELPF